MTSSRRRVLLTGATGNWGQEVVRAFAEVADRFELVALVLPTPAERRAIARFGWVKNLTVLEGDLTDAACVERCVRGVDVVLHLGAVVSPLADDVPELTQRVNVGGTRNLLDAVRAQPRPDAISVVMVGSVAETGDRRPPWHWGRVGDPLRVSHFDEYGQSKVAAERLVVDSGLPRWVWLRQTGIFHAGLLRQLDPIMTHVPFGEVMEWASARDSAKLLVSLSEETVPSDVWGGVFNIGGGDGWRLTNWEFQCSLARALGLEDPRGWYERRWFATRNFHGHWFTDSDRLQQLVPFREETFQQALGRVMRDASWVMRQAGRLPAWLVKHLVMAPVTRRPRGTMAWVRAGDEARVAAFFGSRAEWEALGSWDTFVTPTPDRTPRLLDHGYDEAKAPTSWTVADLREAADFRGGQLVSGSFSPGDVATPLAWRCADGHNFLGSPRLILTAGHWCPTCVRTPADYPRQAQRNRFLAQLELAG